MNTRQKDKKPMPAATAAKCSAGVSRSQKILRTRGAEKTIALYWKLQLITRHRRHIRRGSQIPLRHASTPPATRCKAKPKGKGENPARELN